jgi:hypothetical protein
MNTQQTNDQLIRDVFRRIPAESPSPDFTQKLMSRLQASQPQLAAPSQSVHLGFRLTMALAVTLGFFTVLLITSDFGFMDYFYKFAGNILQGLNFIRLSEFFSGPANIFPEISRTWMVGAAIILAGGLLLIIDRITGNKTGMTGLGCFML